MQLAGTRTNPPIFYYKYTSSVQPASCKMLEGTAGLFEVFAEHLKDSCVRQHDHDYLVQILLTDCLLVFL